MPTLAGKLYTLFRICDFHFADLDGCLRHLKPEDGGNGETTTQASRFSQSELTQIGRDRSKVHLDMCATNADGKVTKECDKALRAMLTDCKERGYQAILVTVPYLNEYNQNFPDALIHRFSQDANAYATEFDVPYLDYSHDERFTDSPELFVDTDHLTSEGSEIFMKIVFADAAEFYAHQD